MEHKEKEYVGRRQREISSSNKKAKEKRERLEEKSQLESKWEMLRWITQFIDRNNDRCEAKARERRNN